MAKKSIDVLLEQACHKSGVPMSDRLPAKTWAAIRRDMHAVVGAEHAGQVIPSQSRLVKYIAEEYGVSVSRFTVAGWLNKLRAGKDL